MTFDEYSKLDEEGRMQVAVAHAAASVVGRDIQVVRRSESVDLHAQIRQLSRRLISVGVRTHSSDDGPIKDDQPMASEEESRAETIRAIEMLFGRSLTKREIKGIDEHPSTSRTKQLRELVKSYRNSRPSEDGD